jgi:hypothetical protein
MSPPGRPKGEFRRPQAKGIPVTPPARPKGEFLRPQAGGIPVSPPGRCQPLIPERVAQGTPVSRPVPCRRPGAPAPAAQSPAPVHPLRQHGAASLAIVVVWLVAASLVVLYVNRALVFEQRTSANQWKATLAFEAAEAGVEWALAALGHPGPLDAQCRTAEAPAAAPVGLRARLLHEDPATGRVTAGPAQAGCLHAAGGDWQCSCPTAGAPSWPAASADAAFLLHVEPGESPGSFGLVAIGCAHPRGFCGTDQADAQARVGVTVAGVPLLAHAPAAPVMAHDAVTLGAGVQVVNTDADSGAYTVVAGGQLAADPAAHLVSRAAPLPPRWRPVMPACGRPRCSRASWAWLRRSTGACPA